MSFRRFAKSGDLRLFPASLTRKRAVIPSESAHPMFSARGRTRRISALCHPEEIRPHVFMRANDEGSAFLLTEPRRGILAVLYFVAPASSRHLLLCGSLLFYGERSKSTAATSALGLGDFLSTPPTAAPPSTALPSRAHSPASPLPSRMTPPLPSPF